MFEFIFGCIATLLVVIVIAWCCDSENKTPAKIDPPINPDELAQTILRNLAAVQLLQLRLNVKSLSYSLAKEMVALQDKEKMILIGIPVEDVEDMADLELQEKKLETLKAQFAVLSELDLPDEHQSGEAVD